ncbi:tyrosine-type recombinase/integrase [Halegenticoccus soli]|uniref:tyrosine-type recombinase/integrase n=1 Tax=Halegenticoccus soli TaxID=1985678 RepID=UPI000C6CD083|nr:site-specific integrase [Halegenticoccus soli]
MTGQRTQIRNLRDRIQESDEIDDEDAELLLQFSDEMDLLKSKYTDHRHIKLLRHVTRIAENVGRLADALEDREASKEIVRWINRKYDNEYTNHDYRTALRVFAKRVTDEEGVPASVEWVPSGTSNSHDPVPNPADMLEWEADVKSMIDAARNPRDKALIAVAFDSGARSGELQELTVNDVNDHEYGLQIMVDGKKGQRSVTLIPSVPYLNRWLSEHPAPDDPDAPLWSKLSKPEEISYRMFNNAFKDAGKRAGVTKPVTPTNFRKSNATWLARQGMPQAFIEDRQGRARGSKATAHYVARFGGESDSQYAKLHGLEVEEEDDGPTGPVECPRCGRDTPREEPVCMWCNQALDHRAVEDLRKDQDEQRRALLRIAKRNPDLLDKLEDIEPVIEAFGGDADLIQAAQQFTEAVGE